MTNEGNDGFFKRLFKDIGFLVKIFLFLGRKKKGACHGVFRTEGFEHIGSPLKNMITSLNHRKMI